MAHFLHSAASTATTPSRSNITKAERLEELRLNDTTYDDHYDMHLYDGRRSALRQQAPIFLSSLLFSSPHRLFISSNASSILLGLCHDYSHHKFRISYSQRSAA